MVFGREGRARVRFTSHYSIIHLQFLFPPLKTFCTPKHSICLSVGVHGFFFMNLIELSYAIELNNRDQHRRRKASKIEIWIKGFLIHHSLSILMKKRQGSSMTEPIIIFRNEIVSTRKRCIIDKSKRFKNFEIVILCKAKRF